MKKDEKISRIFWDYTKKMPKKSYLCTGNRTGILRNFCTSLVPHQNKRAPTL